MFNDAEHHVSQTIIGVEIARLQGVLERCLDSHQYVRLDERCQTIQTVLDDTFHVSFRDHGDVGQYTLDLALRGGYWWLHDGICRQLQLTFHVLGISPRLGLGSFLFSLLAGFRSQYAFHDR